MEEYSLVYVDDNPDEALSEFLDKAFCSEDYIIKYSEIIFKPEEGYESLISDTRIQSANIIIIDSLLFENRTVTGGKFTGEEFMLILKKLFPFIEVIVITQNENDLGDLKLSKYDRNNDETAAEYYAHVLRKKIDYAVSNIRQFRVLANMVHNNDVWETVLKEEVIDTLEGKNTYNLTTVDIDNLISAFKKIQESING